jgi:hypothetical protein
VVAAAVSASASRRTLLVWLLLGVLLAIIAVLEGTDLMRSSPTVKTGRIPVFQFSEADLGAVEAIWQGRGANLVRAAGGQWLRHDSSHRHDGSTASPEHQPSPEDAARIASQLDVTARMLADRRVSPERALEAYGLARPALMLAFYPRGTTGADYARPLSVLYVGDQLPTGYSYYAMLDGERDLTLIPRYQIALLLALLYGEAAAPTPLPSL